MKKFIVLTLNYNEFEFKISMHFWLYSKIQEISPSKKCFSGRNEISSVRSIFDYWIFKLDWIGAASKQLLLRKISKKIQIDDLSHKCSIWELNLENTTPTLCIFFRFSWNLFFGSIDQDKNAFQIFSLVIAWTEK